MCDPRAFPSSSPSRILAILIAESCHVMICANCGHKLIENSRFCTHCGRPISPLPKRSVRAQADDMNLPILYAMVVGLISAVLFPPWETPPGQPPQFLGFSFILNPPGIGMAQDHVGVISRLLLTIELVTIAVAGLYFSWLFRKAKS